MALIAEIVAAIVKELEYLRGFQCKSFEVVGQWTDGQAPMIPLIFRIIYDKRMHLKGT